MSRLSAPCCDFVGEVEEVSLPAGLRAVEARVKAGSAHGKATVPRADTRSKIKQEKERWVAIAPTSRSQRTAMPTAQGFLRF